MRIASACFHKTRWSFLAPLHSVSVDHLLDLFVLVNLSQTPRACPKLAPNSNRSVITVGSG